MIKTWMIGLYLLALPLLADDFIEKKYLVKGMHCGGCESGVRQSLKELGGLTDEQIVRVDHKEPNAKERIGHVIVRWPKASYKGKASDCQLVAAVKKNPGYQMYWDEAQSNPCP